MEANSYLTIRRAFNRVRQNIPTDKRMPFEELCILSHLAKCDSAIPTSEVASYQNALRPTTTHRVNRLASLKYISRNVGTVDKRNIVCAITGKGMAELQNECEQICAVLAEGAILSRIDSERLCRYIDAMGTQYFSAADLVLLSMLEDGDKVSVSELVARLNFLQPTVSMALSTLVSEGKVNKAKSASSGARYTLSASGKTAAKKVLSKVEDIIVRRR